MMSNQDTEFPDYWIRIRVLPESNQFPGSKVARVRRALKALGRAYGIRVKKFSDERRGDAGTDVDGCVR
jgi:hypothetical protein